MSEISGTDALSEWLVKRLPEWACMIAARIALRVAPILRDALCTDETSRRALIILPSFIALAAASYAGAGPDRFRDVRQVARAAARGAGSTMVETFNESQMNVNAVGVASHAVGAIVLAVQADGLAERHRAWSGLGSKWT